MKSKTNPSLKAAVMVGLVLCLTSPVGAFDSEVTVDIAIALDTSGSMRGLIDATRVKLWEIVNDLATAEPAPRMRVALLTYGNQRGSAAAGWSRVETDFTDDLDLVSERLFALQSRGADEYVGRVLKLALEELSWSSSQDALKLLFVAGNEQTNQDPLVDFRDMATLALDREIQLSAVFCGVEQAADAASWREMAELALGRFATIDHRTRSILIPTQYDEELVELSELLSQTFVALGDEGAKRKKSQLSQDLNARRMGLPVAASRALTKSGRYYSPEWDLPTAYRTGEIDLYELDERELPPAMRRLELDQRMYYLEDLLAARGELTARINELGRERQRLVEEQRRARGIDDSRAFDTVIRRTIRQEAEARGLRFGDEVTD